MLKSDPNLFIWNSEVRGYELDIQGIVNNANYFHYFDHVRIQHFLSKGINWEQYHNEGFNLVLIHVDMKFVSPLRAFDKFYVTSRIERSGRLKILFHQSIHKVDDDKLIANSINTVVCVSLKNNKPTMPEHLEKMMFADT